MDLFKTATSTNGSGTTRSVAYRGTVKLTSQGARAITEAFGPDHVIQPEVVIGEAREGAPCLIIYDELSRPWMLAGTPEVAETTQSSLLPKGTYDPTQAYEIDSVVWFQTDGKNYYASADVPAGVSPPNPPWEPLFEAFHPDATQDPGTGQWTAPE